MWKTIIHSLRTLCASGAIRVRSSERTGSPTLGRLSGRVFQRVSSASYMQSEIPHSGQGVDVVSRIRLCVGAHRTLRGRVSDSAPDRRRGVSESARQRIGFGGDSGPRRWITGTERGRAGVSDSAWDRAADGPRIELCVARGRRGPGEPRGAERDWSRIGAGMEGGRGHPAPVMRLHSGAGRERGSVDCRDKPDRTGSAASESWHGRIGPFSRSPDERAPVPRTEGR